MFTLRFVEVLLKFYCIVLYCIKTRRYTIPEVNDEVDKELSSSDVI